MGVHFAKFALFDDVLNVLEPEVLVYEPRKDGLNPKGAFADWNPTVSCADWSGRQLVADMWAAALSKSSALRR